MAPLRTRTGPPHRCRRHRSLKVDSKTKKWVPKEIYDGLDRLTSAITKDPLGATTADYAYAYDPAGNRTSDTFNGVATTAYFNDADQLTSRGAVGYSYDANGNQSASTAGAALAYNAADQTTSLQRAGGSPMSAAYAGLSQVERTTAGPTAFTNTLLGVTAATEAGATTATTRDPAGGLVGLRSGTSRSYYLLDGLGSVAALTDGSGSVTHSYTYDPYGVTTETTTSSLANPWRYTGQYQDVATGLYKMGARYYQPELGRWTQLDPSGAEANAYLYVGGNPVNFVDPSGLFCVTGTYGGPGGGCRGGNFGPEDDKTLALGGVASWGHFPCLCRRRFPWCGDSGRTSGGRCLWCVFCYSRCRRLSNRCLFLPERLWYLKYLMRIPGMG